MGSIFSFIWKNVFIDPFLNVLVILYSLLGNNFGLAVIFLGIIIRLILLPGVKKQLEMTTKMSSLKPQLDKLQEKYKNDQERLAKEQMKLYKEVGYNPLGCLSTFLPQIFILSAIFGVIRAISEGAFDGLYGFVQNLVFGSAEPTLQNLNFLIWDLTKSFNSFENLSILDAQRIPYLFLGLLVGFIQYITTVFIQKFQMGDKKIKKKTDPTEPMSQEEMQMQMSRSMTSIFPLMTAYITLSQPAVLGLYWLAQSIMSVVQYAIIDKNKAIGVLKGMNPFTKGPEESKK